ncbi:hypothetical protein [Kordia sp.]|uniref:hypothetical protein n=1 Tax=Kordia sp. TaxID=1965332 RepID=UPI003B5B5326
MKKIYLFFLFIGITNLTFAQTIKEIDSVSLVFCDYLKQINVKNDTLKINTLYNEQFYPYLNKVEKTQMQKIGNQLYYRMQRNCVGFRELLDRLEPPKEGVTRITEKPTSKMTKKQLEEFKTLTEFYYYEVAGQKTKVVMKDGFWTDYFSDTSTSQLTCTWISDTEFELVFIKSDNESRANFSVKGDRYVYQILAKEDNFYWMTVNIPGQDVYEKSKIYFK